MQNSPNKDTEEETVSDGIPDFGRLRRLNELLDTDGLTEEETKILVFAQNFWFLQYMPLMAKLYPNPKGKKTCDSCGRVLEK